MESTANVKQQPGAALSAEAQEFVPKTNKPSRPKKTGATNRPVVNPVSSAQFGPPASALQMNPYHPAFGPGVVRFEGMSSQPVHSAVPPYSVLSMMVPAPPLPMHPTYMPAPGKGMADVHDITSWHYSVPPRFPFMPMGMMLPEMATPAGHAFFKSQMPARPFVGCDLPKETHSSLKASKYKGKKKDLVATVSVGIQNESGVQKPVSLPADAAKARRRTIILRDALTQTDFSDEIANLTLAQRPSLLYKFGKKWRLRSQANSHNDLTTSEESDSGYSSPQHRKQQQSQGSEDQLSQATTVVPNVIGILRPPVPSTMFTPNAPGTFYATAPNFTLQPEEWPSLGGADVLPPIDLEDPDFLAANGGASYASAIAKRPQSLSLLNVACSNSEPPSNIPSNNESSSKEQKGKKNKKKKKKLEMEKSHSDSERVTERHGLVIRDYDTDFPSLGGAALESPNTQFMTTLKLLMQQDDFSLDEESNVDDLLERFPDVESMSVQELERLKRRIQKQKEYEQKANEELQEIMKEQEELKQQIQRPAKAGKKSRQAMTFDFADLLIALERRQQEAKERAEAAKHSLAESAKGINPLDASAPLVKRGKERENPKPKKPSTLKKIILKEREERKKVREFEELMTQQDGDKEGEGEGNEEECEGEEDEDVETEEEEDEEEEETEAEQEEASANASHIEAKEISQHFSGTQTPNSEKSLNDQSLQDQHENEIPDIAVESIKAACEPPVMTETTSLTRSSIGSSPISQTSPISMSPISFSGGSSLTNSGHQSPLLVGSTGALTHTKRDDVKMRIHSRKFREYCNQVLSKEIDECCTELLRELVRFQDRLYHKDPTKAKSKRRYVLGLREVTKHLKLDRLKCVILAPNCERIQSKGGLDDAINQIIDMAREHNVPFVFALGRRALGRAVAKMVPVSAVGIFEFSGAETFFHNLIELTEEARSQYENMIELLEKEDDDGNLDEELEENGGTAGASSAHAAFPLPLGHSRTPSGCSGISFTSSLLSEPISENYPHSEPETDSRGYEISEKEHYETLSTRIRRDNDDLADEDTLEEVEMKDDTPMPDCVHEIDAGNEADTEDPEYMRRKSRRDKQKGATVIQAEKSTENPAAQLAKELLPRRAPSPPPQPVATAATVWEAEEQRKESPSEEERPSIDQQLHGFVDPVINDFSVTQSLVLPNQDRIESWVSQVAAKSERKDSAVREASD